MLETLAEKIHDNRFLRLMRNMLQAGYLEDWSWGATLSGAPQGGVASPVLSNIYLHRLDDFVENGAHPGIHPRGSAEPGTRPTRECVQALPRARQSGDRDAGAGTTQQAGAACRAWTCDDPGYRRLRYVRYADDTLLRVHRTESRSRGDQTAPGRRSCVTNSSLELSAGKDPDHPRPYRRGEIPRLRDHHPAQRHADAPGNASQRQHRAARARRGDQGQMRALPGNAANPPRQTALHNLGDYNIVAAYGAEYRGIVQYYLLAGDVHRLQPAAVGHGDLAAQDAGGQARLDGVENGGPLQGHHRDPARATHLLRGRPHPRGQGSHWSHGSAASPSNGRRPRSSSTALPAGITYPRKELITRLLSGTGASSASKAARCRSTTSASSPTSHTRPGPASMGQAHGETAAQDPRGLPALPRPDPCRTATSATTTA